MTARKEPAVLLSTDRAAIAYRIQLARKGAGLTQQQFADCIGVSIGRIIEVELRREPPSLDLLAAVRPVLGVSPEWIIHGGGPNMWEPQKQYEIKFRAEEDDLADKLTNALFEAGYSISQLEAGKLSRLTKGYMRPGVSFEATVYRATQAIKDGFLPSDERYHR